VDLNHSVKALQDIGTLQPRHLVTCCFECRGYRPETLVILVEWEEQAVVIEVISRYTVQRACQYFSIISCCDKKKNNQAYQYLIIITYGDLEKCSGILWMIV